MTLLDAIDRAAVRRGVRRRAPRRGEGTRQGAGLQLPRRVRSVGPEEPAPRVVVALQRPAPQGRAHPDLPASNWTEIDIWRYLAAENSICRASTSPTSARSFLRDGMLLPVASSSTPREDEEVIETHGALPHGRRRHDHRRGRVDRGHVRRGHHPRSPRPGSPNAAPPAPTTGSAKPRWKTARRRATSEDASRACRNPPVDYLPADATDPPTSSG